MDYTGKWNKYQVGLNKLSHMPMSFRAYFEKAFFFFSHWFQITDKLLIEWVIEGRVGWQPLQQEGLCRENINQAFLRAGATGRKTSFSFMYRERLRKVPAVPHSLMCMHTTWGTDWKSRFPFIGALHWVTEASVLSLVRLQVWMSLRSTETSTHIRHLAANVPPPSPPERAEGGVLLKTSSWRPVS